MFVTHISVIKRNALISVIIIEAFCALPMLVILDIDLPWSLTLFFFSAFILLFYIPSVLYFFGRIKKGAIPVNISPQLLTIIMYGKEFVLTWDEVRSIKTKERFISGKYARPAGILIETSLPSHNFIKTTVDIFIPDMFAISKEELSKQMLFYANS